MGGGLQNEFQGIQELQDVSMGYRLVRVKKNRDNLCHKGRKSYFDIYQNWQVSYWNKNGFGKLHFRY